MPNPRVDAGGGRDAGSGPDAADEVDTGPGGCELPPGPVGTPAGCEPLRPPPRTTCPEEGEDRTLVWAVLDPDFSRTNGYDLDAYCTPLSGVPNGCINADADETPPDSTEFGTDNSFGTYLIEGFEVVDPNIQMSMRENVREGQGTPLLTVRGWNGTPNDDDVEVEFAVSVGPEDESMPPAWDVDPAPVLIPASSFYDAMDRPVAVDRDAYVTEGVLVMRIPDNQPFFFEADGRAIEVRLTDARITALVDAEGRLSDVTIAGRWSQDNAYAALDLIVCPTDPIFRPAAEQLIRNAADLRADPDEDGMGLDCNAISASIRFETSAPVVISAMRGDPEFGDPCM